MQIDACIQTDDDLQHIIDKQTIDRQKDPIEKLRNNNLIQIKRAVDKQMLINLANEKNQDMDEMTHTVNDQKQTINAPEKRIIKLKERNGLKCK